MSVYLYATKLEITIGSAIAKDHDGKPYINMDYPIGTVIAHDSEGNMYRHIFPFHDGIDKKGHWPNKRNGIIQLYRDYWKHISHDDGSPYKKAINNAKKKLIK